MAALTVAIALAACSEEADESRANPSPNPSSTAIPTPVPLTLGSAAAGSLSAPGERDLYSLTLGSNDTLVELDLDADGVIPSSTRLDARLILYEPDGTIARVIDDGTNSKKPPRMRDPFALLELPPGTYFIAVEDALGDGGPSGFEYLLTARKVVALPNAGGDTCTDAVLLTNLSGVFDGSIVAADDTNFTWGSPTTSLPCVGSPVPGDDRTYRAFLTSGQLFQMVTTGAARDGAFYVTFGCVAGWSAALAEQACGVGADGSEGADGIVFRPAVTGTYFLIVDGVTAPSEGAYRLHVRTLP